MADEYDDRADREIAMWPGVSCERGITNGMHRCLTLHFGGASRMVIYPLTGSDWRGPMAHVTDIRRSLRMLGAQRIEQRRAPKRSKPKPAVQERRVIAKPVVEPRDPWAALRGGK